MFRKSSLVAAGVVFGVVVALTVPSLAHHNPEFERLRTRVSRIAERVDAAENETAALQDQLGSLSAEVDLIGGMV